MPLRIGEASGLRWGEVDLTRGWIRIDGARMKNGETHELPLSEPARQILMSRRDEKAKPADLVFPTPETGVAFKSWNRLTLRVRRAIGCHSLPPDRQFRWHDIRRSFVTLLAEEFDEAALDAMLAHRRKGVAGVYQKQKYLNRRPAIMARWAALIEGDPRVTDPGGNVVPLRASAGG
jgi:integrase